MVPRETFDDAAQPSRDLVRLFGSVVLESFGFVLGGEQKVADAVAVGARASVDGSFDLQEPASKARFVQRNGQGCSFVSLLPGGWTATPGVILTISRKRQGSLRHTSVSPVGVVQTSLRRLLRYTIVGRRSSA